MSAPTASIVIRALNEEEKLGEVLAALQQQTYTDFEVVLVDSGSTDRTVEIAQEYGARILRIPPESFTFGYALNYGFERARGEYLVALSAHAIPPHEGWLERLLSPLERPEVAGCSGGGGFLPGVDPFTLRLRIIELTADNFRSEPTWGFSNEASAVRADLWQRHPFDEKLSGCEDLEWAWFWLKRGYTIIWDEGCSVIHQHEEDLREQFVRAQREYAGVAAFVEVPPYGIGALLTEWLVNPVKESLMALRRGYAASRAVELVGRHRGSRSPSPVKYELELPEAVPGDEKLPWAWEARG